MMEWADIEHLAMWVMEKRFKDYNHDMLGECYLAYEKCKPLYKPEFANFSTYYRNYVEGHLKDYLTYNSNLVHVPRMKQDTHLHPVSSLSQPVSNDDDTLTLLDMIEDSGEAYDAEEKETARWLSHIDDIFNKLSKTEKQAVPYFKRYIVDGTEVPREYRTQIWSIRQKLLDFLEK